MNINWEDKRNKTSFKLIFCILSTELVYNQVKKYTSPSKENISIYLKHNCTHTLGPGLSNIRKLNTARFKTESLYVTFSTKILKSFRFERAH